MPTWIANAPRGVPLHQVTLIRFFPERKIGRISFVRSYSYPDAGLMRFLISASGKFAISFKRLHGKIDVTVYLVGMTGSHQPLNQGNLFRNVGSRRRGNIGAQNPKSIHIFVKTSRVELCNFHRICFFKTGLLHNLVLSFIGVISKVPYISDILYIFDSVSALAEPPNDDIK